MHNLDISFHDDAFDFSFDARLHLIVENCMMVSSKSSLGVCVYVEYLLIESTVQVGEGTFQRWDIPYTFGGK